ncbi:MAG: DNA-directed polymerase, partial [Actinomycetia bacterium]|nr:DNA-directed polymerase [Actinomycetes bacterium]
LAGEFGPMTGPWLVILGRGRGDADVDPTPYVPRSQGREVTYQKNISDWAQVRAEVARLARLVSSEIPERPVNRVVVKIRYAPFITQTHGASLRSSGQQAPESGLAAEFEAAALAALAKFEPDRPVRLLGVRAEFAQ